MSRFLLLVVGLLLVPCSTLHAALDPELEQPYQLQVVLHTGKHRLLTKIFQQQVRRELQDGLQAAFGDMVKVEVVPDHPRLKEILDQGLTAMTTWQFLNNQKTHFVLIDYVNGRYQIQARQHDGLTGQVSPIVRRASTTDRPFVARLATLLIDRDFGIVGTILPGANPKDLPIKIKGGKLGQDLSRWVSKGDIFRLVPIRQGQKTAIPEPDAVIRIEAEPKAGEVKGRLFFRSGEPLAAKSFIQGYRCIKLGTRKGHLRIKLAQFGTRLPADNVRLFLRRHGFEREQDSLLDRVTDPDGFYSSEREEGKKGIFEHVAFVEVDVKPNSAWIPVPIIDDKPVTLYVNTQPRDDRSRLEARKELWRQDLRDTDQMLTGIFNDLRELSKDAKKAEEVLKRANEGLTASKKATERLRQEKEELKEKAKEQGETLTFTQGDRFLANLHDGHQKLDEFIKAQKEVVQESNDPKVKKILAELNRAKLEEEQNDYDEALSIYDQVIKDGYDNKQILEHVKTLRDAWKLKSDAHRDARNFVYNTWPNLDPVNMLRDLPRAKKALEILQQVGDKLTPRKFNQVAGDHVKQLEAAQAALRPDLRVEDEEKTRQVLEIIKALPPLIQLADRLSR